MCECLNVRYFLSMGRAFYKCKSCGVIHKVPCLSKQGYRMMAEVVQARLEGKHLPKKGGKECAKI